MRKGNSTIRFVGAAGAIHPAAAFTLIELLAVIAIIGILEALLFPAVQSGMEKSKSARCLSHMRQIGIGLVAYASENDGTMPYQSYSITLPGGARTWRWADLIQPYVDPGATLSMVPGSGTIGEQPKNNNYGINADGYSASRMFDCPSRPNNNEYEFIVNDKALSEIYPVPGTSIQLSSIPKPAGLVAVSDMKIYNAADTNRVYHYFSPGIILANRTYPTNMTAPHLGQISFNCVYADGHAGSLARTNLYGYTAVTNLPFGY